MSSYEDEEDVTVDDDTAVDDAASDVESVVDEDADADEDAEKDADVDEVAVPELDSNLSRDIIVVPESERMTSNVLSLFELTEIISIRTEQIAKFANCLVDTAGLTTARDQAIREFNERKTPLVLRRVVGERMGTDGKLHTYVELWRPAEMTCIHEL